MKDPLAFFAMQNSVGLLQTFTVKRSFEYLTSHSNADYSGDVGVRNDLGQRARVFAALADPIRLQIVDLLSRKGAMSGSDIADQLGISLALHCHHARILCEAGVIAKRKEGQTTWCTLNEPFVKKAMRSLL